MHCRGRYAYDSIQEGIQTEEAKAQTVTISLTTRSSSTCRTMNSPIDAADDPPQSFRSSSPVSAEL